MMVTIVRFGLDVSHFFSFMALLHHKLKQVQVDRYEIYESAAFLVFSTTYLGACPSLLIFGLLLLTLGLRQPSDRVSLMVSRRPTFIDYIMQSFLFS
jgi:hypothetical protein